MPDSVFGKTQREKDNIQRQILLAKTETDKYFDSEHNLYRYFKFNYFLDQTDDLYKCVEAFHTIPVPKEVSFEEAASRSISFKEGNEHFEKKLLFNHSLTNPSKGTKGSSRKYRFKDGSLLTTLHWYRDNSKI